MKVVASTPRFLVCDDVLTAEGQAAVWNFVQREQYATPFVSGAWQKVWRLGDNCPLGSTEYESHRRPFGTGLDVICEAAESIAEDHPELVGRQEADWAWITLRAYLYPRGTKLSWHDDSRVYTGALIYYVHPVWKPTWGGELFIADVPDGTPEDGDGSLDHTHENRYLMERGMGTYVMPKPNRLVLLKGATYHMLARVDPDAGENARASISGFFHAKEAPSAPSDMAPERKRARQGPPRAWQMSRSVAT